MTWLDDQLAPFLTDEIRADVARFWAGIDDEPDPDMTVDEIIAANHAEAAAEWMGTPMTNPLPATPQPEPAADQLSKLQEKAAANMGGILDIQQTSVVLVERELLADWRDVLEATTGKIARPAAAEYADQPAGTTPPDRPSLTVPAPEPVPVGTEAAGAYSAAEAPCSCAGGPSVEGPDVACDRHGQPSAAYEQGRADAERDARAEMDRLRFQLDGAILGATTLDRDLRAALEAERAAHQATRAGREMEQAALSAALPRLAAMERMQAAFDALTRKFDAVNTWHQVTRAAWEDERTAYRRKRDEARHWKNTVFAHSDSLTELRGQLAAERGRADQAVALASELLAFHKPDLPAYPGWHARLAELRTATGEVPGPTPAHEVCTCTYAERCPIHRTETGEASTDGR